MTHVAVTARRRHTFGLTETFVVITAVGVIFATIQLSPVITFFQSWLLITGAIGRFTSGKQVLWQQITDGDVADSLSVQ